MAAQCRYVAMTVAAVTAVYVIYSNTNGFENVAKRLEEVSTTESALLAQLKTRYITLNFTEKFQTSSYVARKQKTEHVACFLLHQKCYRGAND